MYQRIGATVSRGMIGSVPAALANRVWTLVVRYLPAEVVGSAVMLTACLAASQWTDSIVVIALVAVVAESVGFYGVIVAMITREQWRLTEGRPRRIRVVARRTLMLTMAEFAPAELVDTVTRAPVMALGIFLLGPGFVGLMAGKIVADLVFYTVSGSLFHVTRDTGLRQPRTEPVDDLLRERRLAELRELLDRPDVSAGLAAQGTPLQILDTERVRLTYRRLGAAFSTVRFHYAVKALPHPSVIEAIDAEGGWFDVASLGELDLVRSVGVSARRVIHTHPVKSRAEIVAAVGAGVDVFVIDSPGELRKFIDLGVDARILVRLAYRNDTAVSDLSAKFGVDHDAGERLVEEGLAAGLDMAGFSFHVGSQTCEVEKFVSATAATIELMERLESRYEHRFTLLDIGGGFPAAHEVEVISIEEIAEGLNPLLESVAAKWQVIAEPGRVVVADAMTSLTTVVGTAERDGATWCHLDDGVYGTWSNVVFEHIRPIVVAEPELRGAARTQRVVLAGPTCDSIDVIATESLMPELVEGDVLMSPTMGAYTSATATEFNGLQSQRVLVLGRDHQPAPKQMNDVGESLVASASAWAGGAPTAIRR